jgi:hypothetical protein
MSRLLESSFVLVFKRERASSIGAPLSDMLANFVVFNSARLKQL